MNLVQYNKEGNPVGPLTLVREQEFKKLHEVFQGAPNTWAKERGATHTLWTGTGIGKGTRPAKLLKTRLYVGIDEDEQGQIIWEKWNTTVYLEIT